MGAGDFDVREFSVLATRGHAAAEAGAWARRPACCATRWRCGGASPSPTCRHSCCADREVPSLEDQRLQALVARIDADLHLGRHGEVAAELRQLVAAHPLQEQFHAQLMLSLYRSGRQADALAAYQDVRRVVAEELGIDPSPELRVLHQRILAADERPAARGGRLAVRRRGGDAQPG